MTLAEDDSEEPPTLGETLRALRQEEGMTIAELANLLSITGSAVREWESDNHYPIAKHYQDLISLFPPLASFKEGRGISKPVGQTFVQRKSETAPPAPVVSEDAFAIDSREVFRMMEEGTESANVNGARRIIRAKKESPMNSLTSLGKIAPQITTVMVYDDESFIKRNRTREKLAERGLKIVREYKATSTPPEITEVGAVVMFVAGASSEAGRWKSLSERVKARFFLLNHQVSSLGWKGLEEWVGQSLTKSGVQLVSEGGSDELEAELHRAMANLKDREVDLRKANSENLMFRNRLAEYEAESASHEATEAKIKALERTVVEANRERDALREQVASEEKKLVALRKTMAENSARWEKDILELAKEVEEAKRSAPSSVARPSPVSAPPASLVTIELVNGLSALIACGEMTGDEAWQRVVARVTKSAEAKR